MTNQIDRITKNQQPLPDGRPCPKCGGNRCVIIKSGRVVTCPECAGTGQAGLITK